MKQRDMAALMGVLGMAAAMGPTEAPITLGDVDIPKSPGYQGKGGHNHGNGKLRKGTRPKVKKWYIRKEG